LYRIATCFSSYRQLLRRRLAKYKRNLQSSQLPYYQKRVVLSVDVGQQTKAAKPSNSLELLPPATSVLRATTGMYTLPHMPQAKTRMLEAYVRAQFSTQPTEFSRDSKQACLAAYNSRPSYAEAVFTASEAVSARNGSRYRSMTRRQLIRQRTLLYFFTPNVPPLRTTEKVYVTFRQKDKYALLHNRYRAIPAKLSLGRDHPRYRFMRRTVRTTNSSTLLSNRGA
jgi:hypothetical protein